jgi:hypothetical protein
VPVAGAVNGNFREFEFVAGPLPDTVMATAAAPVPRKAVSAGVIAAVSCVGLTTVVGRGEPFQLTTSPFAKPAPLAFVPFIVRVKPVELQYGVLFAEVVDAESAVMFGRTIAKEIALLDGPPPQLTSGPGVHPASGGLNAVTWLVPTEAISAAGTVAVSWAGLN